MRLPEICDISGKSKVENFDGQKLSENVPYFRQLKIFAKLIENLTKRPKYTGKCQKYTGIFDMRQYMSKITINFLNFQHIPSIKWPKFDQI